MIALPDALVSTLSRHLALSNSRLETMVVIILGLMNGRTVNLSHIASQFCGTARLASSYPRLQRFFQFVRLDEAWLARTLIGFLNLRAPFTLYLERTNWKVGAKDINLLVLCIATRRVRIPVLWSVLEAGSSIGDHWFEFLLANDIPFAIRVKENLTVILNDGRKAPLASLTKRKKTRRQLADHKGCFATNREPNAALSNYRKRWQVECLFGDTKTRGFNMQDTRLTQPEKLNLLVAMVTLALARAHACASRSKGRTNIQKASHGYRRKSWFRTDLDMLRHWILAQPRAAENLWQLIWTQVKYRSFTTKGV